MIPNGTIAAMIEYCFTRRRGGDPEKDIKRLYDHVFYPHTRG